MINLLGIELQAYTALVGAAVVISMAGVIVAHPGQRGSVFNALLAGLIGGLIVGRLVHVLLNIAYFRFHVGEAFNISAGGLDWHGVTIGALLALRWWARRADLPLSSLQRALAVAVPLIGAAAWAGCSVQHCSYGAEVATLADYPPLTVHEAPDIYGFYAPRYNPQLVGSLTGAVITLAVGATVLITPWKKYQLWITIALWCAVMFVLGFMRGDYALMLAGLRVDQWLDLLLGAAALLIVMRRADVP